MVQQSSIKRALTSSKQDKWPKRTPDPLCPLTASTWAREHECADPGIFVGGGGGGGGGRGNASPFNTNISDNFVSG